MVACPGPTRLGFFSVLSGRERDTTHCFDDTLARRFGDAGSSVCLPDELATMSGTEEMVSGEYPDTEYY